MTDDLVKRLRAEEIFEMDEAADRIEKLELRSEQWKATATTIENERLVMKDRIEALESALRSIAANACCDSCREAALVARKALEGKDD